MIMGDDHRPVGDPLIMGTKKTALQVQGGQNL
jgi:hypothetical protein